MLVLEQLTNNELNIELVPTIDTPYWYFYFTFEDLDGKVVELFLTPSYISERFYTFTLDTTANTMQTGEWILQVFELASNDPSPDISSLDPSYVSIARIYKNFAEDNYHTLTLNDERID